MTRQEYEQQRRECWEEFRTHVVCGTDNPKGWFERAFDSAYALGKKIGNPDFSDEEVEEMLTCDRDVVRMLYDRTDSVKVRQVLEGIFGSKCLPDAHEDNFASKDELNEDNFARFETKPAEPKNKDCDNHLADVGKMMDRRLNIAAMAMQGILSNADRMKGYEHVATTPPCEELTVVVARNALRYADALIAEAERTDKLNK